MPGLGACPGLGASCGCPRGVPQGWVRGGSCGCLPRGARGPLGCWCHPGGPGGAAAPGAGSRQCLEAPRYLSWGSWGTPKPQGLGAELLQLPRGMSPPRGIAATLGSLQPPGSLRGTGRGAVLWLCLPLPVPVLLRVTNVSAPKISCGSSATAAVPGTRGDAGTVRSCPCGAARLAGTPWCQGEAGGVSPRAAERCLQP